MHAFIPEAIIDHKISFTPRKQVILANTSDETPTIKITRSRHVRLRVWWKTGELTWVPMDSLSYQNPWVVMLYVNKRKLKNHPDFKWVN